MTPTLFEVSAKSVGTGLAEPQFVQQANSQFFSTQVVKDVCLANDWQYLLDVAPQVEEEVIGFSTARSSNFGK